MSGQTQDYIERNLLTRLAELERRLEAVERSGGTAEATAAPPDLVIYEEITGEPYTLVLRLVGGRPVLFVRQVNPSPPFTIQSEAQP
jgi:hypothetical protein